MLRRPRRLPSPAFVLSLIAVFAGLGGSAVAASKLISGTQIRRNSLPGNRLKAASVTGDRLAGDTITGGQISEASLAKVPSAAAADTATSAANATHAAAADTAVSATNATHAATADTANSAVHATSADGATAVGGVRVLKIQTRVATGGPTATVLEQGTLKITLTCPAGKPVLTGATPDLYAMLRGSTVQSNNAVAAYGSSTAGSTPITMFDGVTAVRGTTTFVYATDGGPVISGTLVVDDANTYGNFAGCSATGTVDVTS